MESLSKTNATEIQLQKIVDNIVDKKIIADINCKNFSKVELKNGCFNKVYLLKFPEKEIILKISPNNKKTLLRYEDKIMETEVRTVRILTGKTTVKIPEIYFYDKSQSIVDFDYYFMEKIDGVAINEIEADLSTAELEKIDFEIGKINREINSVTSDKFGYIGQDNRISKRWVDTFEMMLCDVLSDGADGNIALPCEEIMREFARFKFAFDDVKTPRLVHWDLWRGNVLYKNGEIKAVIDFERAIWGDALMESFFAVYSYSKSFYDGYGFSPEDFDRNAVIRRAFYDLYCFCVMKVEACYRGYADLGQYNWASDYLETTLTKIKEF